MSSNLSEETTGNQAQDSLVALVGSRICHDLVSPLGAIGNGLELMLLSGGEESPEMALVNESLAGANARIRFFRLAFGDARPGQMVKARDIAEALAVLQSRKLSVTWMVEGDLARVDVKLALLAVNCLETAMPYGGEISVSCAGATWHVTGTAERFNDIPDEWSMAQGTPPPVDLMAAKVHFPIIAQELSAQARHLTLEDAGTAISLSF